MTFEFRFYCQSQPAVISVQVEAADEDAAAMLAAQAVHDLGRRDGRWWEWKPGVRVLPGCE
jgi:hypothetical protein